MDATLRIKIKSEYLAVKYRCRMDLNRKKNATVIMDNNQLAALIQDGMECEVSPAGAPSWAGTVNGVEKNDGKISLQIMKTEKEILS